MSNKPQYMVLAQYLEGMDGVYPSLFDRRHLKVMGTYTPSEEAIESGDIVDDIIRQFMDEYMSSPADAQRFFPKIQIVELGGYLWRPDIDITPYVKARLGEVVRLPNPSRFTEVSYYFLRGDVE